MVAPEVTGANHVPRSASLAGMHDDPDTPQDGGEALESSKVLQVLPALGKGGVERGTIDIARHLVAEGWQALVASAGGPGAATLEAVGARTLHLPLKSKSPLAIRANIGRLEELIRAEGVDLVHARSRAPAWSAYYAARRCGVPFVTTCHGVYSGSRHWLKHYYNAVMAKGDRVIAPSEYVAEHLREHYAVGADRLRVVPRGVDLEAFDPEAVSEERAARLARQWRIEPGKKVIMLPGRITRIKGHLVLLQAIERLARTDFVCLLVGGLEAPGRYVSELEKRIRARGQGETARLVGACEDMPAAFALADIVVVPSIGPETFGRVSVEAQAMGKPVIVTNIGGLGETVMPASTGWLIPPDDPVELAWALERALALEADVRLRLAARARAYVQKNFSAKAMGARTLAVYRELLRPVATARRPAQLEAVG